MLYMPSIIPLYNTSSHKISKSIQNAAKYSCYKYKCGDLFILDDHN